MHGAVAQSFGSESYVNYIMQCLVSGIEGGVRLRQAATGIAPVRVRGTDPWTVRPERGRRKGKKTPPA